MTCTALMMLSLWAQQNLDLDTSASECDEVSFLKHFQHIKDTLPEEKVDEVLGLLQKWPSVFSHHDLDLGLTNQAVHHIKLNDDTPFKEKSRPIPPMIFEEVHDHLKEMETLEVI